MKGEQWNLNEVFFFSFHFESGYGVVKSKQWDRELCEFVRCGYPSRTF